MHGRALSPSPIAVFLLGLAERGADGSVDVGGRRVLLRKGQVVEVRPADGDGDLAGYLRDSGRVAPEPLERCVVRAREEGLPLEEVLVRQRLLSSELVRDVRRGLWLDRLVRGMARAAAEEHDVAPLQAEVGAPEGPAVNLVTFVLDALERRAGEDDAGQVGARAQQHLEWLETPHAARARRWARFDGRGSPARAGLVASLLKTEPAAASRIAALIRAGLARIVAADGPPAPAPRVAPLPATAPPSRTTPPLGSVAPAPPRPISVELAPALFPIFDGEPTLEAALPSLPAPAGALDDPLDALERGVAALEQAGAPGHERAAAWMRFGDAWEERLGSLEEAARAYREAAAADSDDRDALLGAAERCAALGLAELAVAYGRAAVSATPEGPARGRALVGHALLCRRLGMHEEALGALRAARAAAPDDPEPMALAAQLWRDLGRTHEAAEAASEAAVHARDPERRLALAALAYDRSSARAEAYARALGDHGLADAAVAVLADAARHADDPDIRRSLRVAAAEQAELHGRAEVAADLFIRAFDAEPHVDLFYEPLDALLAAAPLERALLLEEIAAVAPPEAQAGFFARAADARLALPGDGGWEAELRVRALELAPEEDTCWRAIREQAAAAGDPRLLCDALERAIRRGRWSGAEPQRRALIELAGLAEEELAAPALAAWAWERVRALAADDADAERALRRLEPALEAHRARRRALEDAGDGEALAALLRDDPARRRHALGLYRDAEGPADGLEALLRLLGEDDLAALERRAEAADRKERVRLRLRIAALAALAGRFEEAAAACARILEELPSHREAALRLRRAAERLGDAALRREALTAERAQPLPPLVRARVLSALALELEAEDPDEARACAEAALDLDPRAAEAALLLLRQLEPRLDRGRFESLRALFADHPAALEAARDLDTWARIMPYDPGPAALGLSTDDPAALAAAIDAALAPERLTPDLAPKVAAAIARVAERGDVERACTLAHRAVDAFGAHADALRELFGQLARASGDRQRRRDALERRLAGQRDDGRIELLTELATLHREQGDRAAEARTHLRILASRPHEPRALDRLATLYAETGETERLMAALALALDAAPEAERLGPLMKLASASARLRGDLDRAERFLWEAWTPSLSSLDALFESAGALVTLGRPRRAVERLREAGRALPPRRAAPVFLRGVQIALKKIDDPRLALVTAVEGLEHAPSSSHLLLAFEELAMQLHDVDGAEATFRRLMDRAMGPHGRRALAYRRARWLEQAGLPSLPAYLEAFERAPQAGAVYASIERLARAEGDIEALARAATLVAEHAGHPAVRASMAREAARIFERELGDRARAFEVVAGLWEAGDAGAEADMTRLARALRADDAARGEAAFGRLLDGLRKRADDAWMGNARARLLMRQARVHALGRRDLDAARAAVEEALGATAEEGDPDLASELHLEAASWCFEAGRHDEACAHVREALRARPANEAARALAAQLGITLDTDAPGHDAPAQEAFQPAMVAGVADVPSPPVPQMSQAEAHAPAVSHVVLGPDSPAASGAPAPTRVLVPEAMGRWRPVAPPSTPDDPETLERDARTASSPERALELLRAAVALAPARLSVWRAIAESSAPGVEVHSARALLGLIDPTLAPAEPFAPPSRLRERLRDPDLAAIHDIWALLWEQAQPLFRRAPDRAPEPNARVTRVATTPEARAFTAALDALGRDELPAFYFERDGAPTLTLARTAPPCIIAGPGFAGDEPGMRFALGSALERSQPEHLLIATLPEAEARVAAAAVSAAFGPAEDDTVPREAAALASELWGTIPPRAQSGLRELLARAGDRWLDYDLVRDATDASGARAGLVACGDLGVAVRALCAPALTLDTEAALEAALRLPPVAALVRFALGPLAE